MFIRPRRFRMILAFLLGLAISIVALIGGYFYYRSNLDDMESEIRVQAMEETQAVFNDQHPMAVVYVFHRDKRSGDLIEDTDLIPAEIGIQAIPADAVLSPEEARGMVVRCDVMENTVVTRSLFFTEEDYPDDLRLMEHTVINLPSNLEAGHFIDVRVMFPNGLDYIILSKKKVIDHPEDESGDHAMIRLHMTEEEILRMSSAIVDASLVEGSFLYAVQYVAPDIQKAAAKTYPANLEVLNLISSNPNIVNHAIETLEARNRLAFEQRMDQKLISAGKRGVYEQTGEYEVPPEVMETDQTGSGSEEVLAGELNGDL